MQIRERAKLTEQMPAGTSYGPATVWRCILGLALVIVVTYMARTRSPCATAH